MWESAQVAMSEGGGAAGARKPTLLRRPLVAIALTVLALTVATVAVLVVQHFTGDHRPTSTDPLDAVPADASSVTYIDWAALGHPDPRSLPASPSGGGWIAYSAFIPGQLGVQLSQSSWELAFFEGDNSCDIFQWPDQTGPTTIADALTRNGWGRKVDGNRAVFTRPARLIDDTWGWAVARPTFAIDNDLHRVADCHQQSALDGALGGRDNSFATLPAIRALTAVAGPGALSIFRLNSGTNLACVTPRQLRSLAVTSPFAAMELSQAGGDDSSAALVLAYPSSDAARADIGNRSAAFSQTQADNAAAGLPTARLDSIAPQGSAIVARFAAIAKPSVWAADNQGQLGVDTCSAQ
jgi:hypothetical protein